MVQGLKAGQTLQNGTYRIERVLGQGSFGITYLARAKFTTQGNLGKMNVEAKVAIKEFFMSEVNSRRSDGSSVEGSSGNVFTNYRKKFKKEAENLSKLSHPNIVKVFDVFDENNTTYYVMEFLEGTNLDDYIKQVCFLPEKEAISIINEIGDALAYMHSQKMLHLDIKPKNIVRKSDGKDYLIDFGLSKQFTEEGEPESSTSIGLGTPGYAPIEQSGYKQDGTFPATLDVYALGATMFKMLTGKRPPEATNILNEGFPDNELSNSGVSKNTAAAVEKAMEPVKKKRFQNVKSFLKGLENSQIEDTTIIETPIKPKPAPTPKPKPKPIPTPQPPGPTPNPKNKWIYLICYYIGLISLLATCVVVLRHKPPKESQSILIDSTTSTTIKRQMPSTVTDMAWDSPLGQAVYTGSVQADSIVNSDKLIPHGKGYARITAGQFAGSIYDGEFSWGKYEGQTKYRLPNGDVFEGAFKNNEYANGTYTIKSSEEYFKGSFKNGQPNDGQWYSKNEMLLPINLLK